MFAYSNNGLTFRAVDAETALLSGEVLFDDYATPDQLVAAFPGYHAALAAQAASKPAPTPRQWFERLASPTRLAIETAALSNAQIRLLLDIAAGNPTIDVTNPETIQGVAALLNAGLISAAEQTALLAP